MDETIMDYEFNVDAKYPMRDESRAGSKYSGLDNRARGAGRELGRADSGGRGDKK